MCWCCTICSDEGSSIGVETSAFIIKVCYAGFEDTLQLSTLWLTQNIMVHDYHLCCRPSWQKNEGWEPGQKKKILETTCPNSTNMHAIKIGTSIAIYNYFQFLSGSETHFDNTFMSREFMPQSVGYPTGSEPFKCRIGNYLEPVLIIMAQHLHSMAMPCMLGPVLT